MCRLRHEVMSRTRAARDGKRIADARTRIRGAVTSSVKSRDDRACANFIASTGIEAQATESFHGLTDRIKSGATTPGARHKLTARARKFSPCSGDSRIDKVNARSDPVSQYTRNAARRALNATARADKDRPRSKLAAGRAESVPNDILVVNRTELPLLQSTHSSRSAVSHRAQRG